METNDDDLGADERGAIACTLGEPELRARQTELRTAFAATIAAVAELPDGYRLVVTRTPGAITTVARFVELERSCCRFLSFTLEAAAEDGEVALAVTGPPGAKEFLRGMGVLLGASEAPASFAREPGGRTTDRATQAASPEAPVSTLAHPDVPLPAPAPKCCCS